MGVVELAVVAVMVAVNGVFAAYEIALAAVSIARLQVLAGEGRAGASAALAMKQNMEGSLAVVQLGITLVGVVAAATAGGGAEESLAPWLQARLGIAAGLADALALVLVVVPLTVVTIVAGELVPKVFALRNKEWVGLKLSPAMKAFATVVRPAVWLLETAVGLVMRWGRRWQPSDAGRGEAAELQELRALAAQARLTHLIGTRQENIILAAADLAQRPIRPIAVPAEHMVTLAVNDALADSLIIAHQDMHTRFPVVERRGDPQSVIGYVNFKDLVAVMHVNPHEPTLRGILRLLPSLPENTTLSAALEQLIHEHSHIALVRDPAGRVAGLITLEDILEELVGEVPDEYDRLPTHALTGGSSWVFGGGVSLARVRELTGLDLASRAPQPDTPNLSAWVTGHLGRGARGGDRVERDGVRALVRKARRQKVLEAQVSRASGAALGSS
jgi:putative hemolysin